MALSSSGSVGVVSVVNIAPSAPVTLRQHAAPQPVPLADLVPQVLDRYGLANKAYDPHEPASTSVPTGTADGSSVPAKLPAASDARGFGRQG